MAKVTYSDKVALNVNPEIADINKVKDTDMNEIKNAINSNETKILVAVSDTEPTECSTGDLYFNTNDNLIYEAAGTDTWSSTGVAPTENTIYILFDNQTAYAYDGTTLISVGGGSGDLIMVNEEPTEDTKLYIEDEDLEPQGLEIVNEYNNANNMAYSCDYVNNCETYSTDEVKTNKVWIDGKPIYRKVLSIGSVSAGTTKDISVSSLNISELFFNTSNSYIKSGSIFLTIPRVHNSDATAQVEVRSTTTTLSIRCGAGITIDSGYITIEYTKTTD